MAVIYFVGSERVWVEQMAYKKIEKEYYTLFYIGSLTFAFV